jgi:uncharacterized damage-inducible protein DinB
MNKEVQYLITTFETTLQREPWYGRSVYSILEEIDPTIVYIKPGETEHSLIDLLYHMIAWAMFTQKRLEKDKGWDDAFMEKIDWRTIDPAEHTWHNGVKQLKETHEQIIGLLRDKDDSLLSEMVDFRKYNFRFLLNGLIQHNVYHLGQIAYVKKLLSR